MRISQSSCEGKLGLSQEVVRQAQDERVDILANPEIGY
jgi:hypothetical protein